MQALEDYRHISIKDLKPKSAGFIQLGGQRISFGMFDYGHTKNRPFFLCPKCKQRREKLYLKDDAYACRKCHDLIYRSSLAYPKRRQIDKAKKIRRGLGEENLFVPFPTKPPKMRWAKYVALKLEDQEIKHSCGRLLLRGET